MTLESKKRHQKNMDPAEGGWPFVRRGSVEYQPGDQARQFAEESPGSRGSRSGRAVGEDQSQRASAERVRRSTRSFQRAGARKAFLRQPQGAGVPGQARRIDRDRGRGRRIYKGGRSHPATIAQHSIQAGPSNWTRERGIAQIGNRRGAV